MSRAPPIFNARDCFYQYTTNAKHEIDNADVARAYDDNVQAVIDLKNAREWLDALIRAIEDD